MDDARLGNAQVSRGGAWPSSWDTWLADKSWRAALARAIEQRELAELSGLCECWIGLECHARLDTGRKLFCAVPEGVAGWVDIGLPGALPSLDPKAAERASDLGSALGASLSQRFGFERKRYAYPDLSKGYQTTQKALCVWFGGEVEWEGGTLLLDRAQIEEDAAKVKRVAQGFEMDFGRAGSPLLEIVSKAAPMWPSDAALAMKALWREAVHSGASQGRIEEGHFKSDINVSLRPCGSDGLGERVEVKGVGSFEFAKAAGEDIVWMLAGELLGVTPMGQRTYGFVEETMSCAPMREKAADCDYKFLPDGDLALRGPAPAGKRRPSWWLSKMSLAKSFGEDDQTLALWDDPRKSRAAIEIGGVGLSAADSLGTDDAGALARGFFGRVDRLLLEEDPQAAGQALAWVCIKAAAGSRRSAALDAALGGLGRGFEEELAEQLFIQARGVFCEKTAARLLSELLSEDAKAMVAWGQVIGGKPKAMGYVLGAMGSRWVNAMSGQALDKVALSTWMLSRAHGSDKGESV